MKLKDTGLATTAVNTDRMKRTDASSQVRGSGGRGRRVVLGMWGKYTSSDGEDADEDIHGATDEKRQLTTSFF